MHTVARLDYNLDMATLAARIATAPPLRVLPRERCAPGQGFPSTPPLDAAAAQSVLEERHRDDHRPRLAS